MDSTPAPGALMNAAELLLAGAAEAPALLTLDEGTVTYGELRQRVALAAAAWQAHGLRVGERGILAMSDGVDWVAAFLGAIWLGAQPIAISPRTDVRMIGELVVDSAASAALLDDEVATAMADPRLLGRSAWRALCASGLAPVVSAHPTHADDAAFWLYSSGTTGKPKGILHAHRAALHADAFAREVLGAGPGDRIYSTSKLFFAYPLANALFAGLRLGASVVLDPQWPNPERVAANLAHHRPTVFFSVPTLYRRLTEEKLDFHSVRTAVSAGESCPPDVAAAWRQLTGIPLVNGYGTTETLSLMLYKTEDMTGFRPTPLTTACIDPEQPGDGALRLWFQHPAVSLGYSREVVGDSARFGAEGFSPGDLFRPLSQRAEDGWTFAGRSDQLLKVFGRWVDTLALEHAIVDRLHGQVREACIVAHTGNNADTISLHLFVIPSVGDASTTRTAIEAAIADLPAYQRPQGIHVVDDLPRTETGKLRRGVLVKMLASGEF